MHIFSPSPIFCDGERGDVGLVRQLRVVCLSRLCVIPCHGVAPSTDTGGGGAEPVEGVCRYKRGEKGSRQAVEQTKKLKIGHNHHTSRLKVRERLTTTPYRRRQVKQGVMMMPVFLY